MNNRVVPFSWKQASKTCPSLPLLPVNFSSLAWQPWFCLSFFMVYVVWPFDHCWCFLPAGLHHPGNMVPQLGTTVSHLCKVKWKDQFIVLLLTPYFSHFFFFFATMWDAQPLMHIQNTDPSPIVSCPLHSSTVLPKRNTSFGFCSIIFLIISAACQDNFEFQPCPQVYP